MCNFCNTCSNNGRVGCGCSSCCNGNGSFWNWGRQSVCRDCNGNIWVNQRNTCGCGCSNGSGWSLASASSCGCNNGCGCNGNGTDTASNGNGNGGRFTCVTYCGTNGLTTATSNGDLYYARQYGLYPFGYHSGCGCTLDAVSEA